MRMLPPLPRRVVAALAMLALLAVLAALPALAQSAVPSRGTAASAQSTSLSTEQLIEQAHSRGEITAEQRILYLAYAVYEFKSLPAQYHGTAGWYGTAAVAEIDRTIRGQGTGKGTSLSPSVAVELARLTRALGALCNKSAEANNTETANFRVNYGTVKGGLTIEQYTAGLEKAYTVEVTQYGWPKPPFSAANAFGRYPVQVADLAASGDGNLYGYVTTNSAPITAFLGDNPNTSATETDAFATCMVLNDNIPSFTGGDATQGLKALDNTVAHEFVHAIQFGVGSPDPSITGMWVESAAAYAEDEVEPNGRDNYQYLWPNFQQSLVSYPQPSWYSNWPMFRYGAEQNGGLNTPGGGETVYKDFLANVAAGQAAITAYDNALKARGKSFNDFFHDYAIAIRFTKKCPIANSYCFSDGDLIAARMQATPIASDGDVSSIGASYSGNITDTYAINYVSLPSSGSYSVDVANTASNGELRASVVADTGDGLQVATVPGVAGMGQSATLASYTPPAGAQSVILVITNQGKTSGGAPNLTSYRVTLGQPGEAPTPTPTLTVTPTPSPTQPAGEYTHFAFLPLVGSEYNFEAPLSLTR